MPFGSAAPARQNSNAVRVAAGQKSRSGRGADSLGDAEARKAAAFAGHAIEMRSLDSHGAKAAKVRIAQIVGIHDDEIGQVRPRFGRRTSNGETRVAAKGGQRKHGQRRDFISELVTGPTDWTSDENGSSESSMLSGIKLQTTERKRSAHASCRNWGSGHGKRRLKSSPQSDQTLALIRDRAINHSTGHEVRATKSRGRRRNAAASSALSPQAPSPHSARFQKFRGRNYKVIAAADVDVDEINETLDAPLRRSKVRTRSSSSGAFPPSSSRKPSGPRTGQSGWPTSGPAERPG